MPQPETNERRWVWLLCLLAAIHVFIFSAAFPFFNNVDEGEHFSLLVDYSHGKIPRTVEPMSAEALHYIAAYGTPEYLYPANPIQPPIQPTKGLPSARETSLIIQELAGQKNYEATQPPLYYLFTGLGWDLGKRCGLQGGSLLYAIRFLNIVFVGALVWLGYLAAKTIFPEKFLVRLGVPALLAFMPQTTFYSLQNDVLSPVCFGLAFICLVRSLPLDTPNIRLGILTGLALAATGLAKLTNLPLLLLGALVLSGKIWQWFRAGKLQSSLPMLAALMISFGVPLLLWFAWCKHNFGDFTGSELKIQYLGWTHKPFSEWWEHPIFTGSGFLAFFSQLLTTFWQGEILWRGQALNFPAINSIYVVVSVSLLGLAIHGLLTKTTNLTRLQQEALWLSLASFVAAIAFLGFVSIIYDFHQCVCPSRDFPYFTAGRMILGSLIPFLLLLLFGLDHLLESTKNRWVRPLVLAGVIAFMLASEIATNWPVFSSPYNWFHI